jgi:hypothetical protein
MNKTVLLAAAAAFALTAGAASAAQRPALGVTGAKVSPVVVHKAKGAKMLYNQNSPDGTVIVSMNFTSGTYTAYDSAGADDFVVPKKAQWTVTEVDASGAYFNGNGTCSSSCEYATSENVTFYKDAGGMPGAAVKGGTFTDLKGKDTNGVFAISLGKKGLKLKSGHYWVSVAGNVSFTSTGYEWGWGETTAIQGDDAMWENPGAGFGVGCTTWGDIGTCLGYSGDLAFDLQGTSKKGK